MTFQRFPSVGEGCEVVDITRPTWHTEASQADYPYTQTFTPSSVNLFHSIRMKNKVNERMQNHTISAMGHTITLVLLPYQKVSVLYHVLWYILNIFADTKWAFYPPYRQINQPTSYFGQKYHIGSSFLWAFWSERLAEYDSDSNVSWRIFNNI